MNSHIWGNNLMELMQITKSGFQLTLTHYSRLVTLESLAFSLQNRSNDRYQRLLQKSVIFPWWVYCWLTDFESTWLYHHIKCNCWCNFCIDLESSIFIWEHFAKSIGSICSCYGSSSRFWNYFWDFFRRNFVRNFSWRTF